MVLFLPSLGSHFHTSSKVFIFIVSHTTLLLPAWPLACWVTWPVCVPVGFCVQSFWNRTSFRRAVLVFEIPSWRRNMLWMSLKKMNYFVTDRERRVVLCFVLQSWLDLWRPTLGVSCGRDWEHPFAVRIIVVEEEAWLMNDEWRWECCRRQKVVPPRSQSFVASLSPRIQLIYQSAFDGSFSYLSLRRALWCVPLY